MVKNDMTVAFAEIFTGNSQVPVPDRKVTYAIAAIPGC
jgi:hypothetical protein